MTSYYKDAPQVEYPNLFFEVSDYLNYSLKGYGIEHTNAEITLLRDRTLKGLEKAGINQQNYCSTYNKIKVDAINFEINNFYKTNYCQMDLSKNNGL